MQNPIVALLPMVVMFALFYFMLIRPQKKATEKKKQMLENIQRGDGVVTIGGLHGVVDEVDLDNRIVVLDCEGIFLTYELNAIANVKQTAGKVGADVEDLAPEASQEDVEDFESSEEALESSEA